MVGAVNFFATQQHRDRFPRLNNTNILRVWFLLLILLKIGTVALKVAQEEHRVDEGALRGDKRALKVELKEMELSHENITKNLQLEYDKNVTKLRDDLLRQARELQNKYDKKMTTLRDDLELRRKTELLEIEERKNFQINTLMKNHEKAFLEIKNYYNEITLQNLALINTLKETVFFFFVAFMF